MSTSIRYLPPNDTSPPMRSAPISGRQQYSPQNATVLAPGQVPRPLNHEIDQQMRMFMAEKARGTQVLMPASLKPRNRTAKPHPAPAIATSATWYTGGPSPRIITRTELWRTGGSPSTTPVELDSSQTRQLPPPRPTRNPTDSWPVIPPRSNRSSSDGSQSASSLESRNGNYMRRANTQLERRVSTDARSFRSSTASMSPPPTPPAKDEHWQEIKSPKPPAKSRMDSVILPPPPPSLMPQRSSSLRRQNNPNLRIAVPFEEGGKTVELKQQAKTSGKKRKSPKLPAKDATVLENVLGIYPAENKLPPGRSAADDFVSKIATLTKFSKKSGSQDNLPLSSKSVPTPINSKENTPVDHAHPPNGQPWTASAQAPAYMYEYSKTDGMIIAELPATNTVRAPVEQPQRRRSPPSDRERSSQRKASSSSDGKSRSKSRSTSKKGRKLDEASSPPQQALPPRPTNDSKYANMPLPAVPPPQSTTNSSPPGSLRSRSPLKLKIPAASAPAPLTEEEARKQRLDGNFSPDVNYGKDIADWAESFYTSKTPNSSSSSSASPAIHVSQSAINPATRASVLNPEGAVRGMLLPQQPIRRPSRRSTVRVSTQRAMSMSPSEWSRISYASSIGDAFQYDAFADSGALGTIGEDETTDTPNHAATTSPTADDDDEYTSDLDDDDLLNGFPDDLDTDTYSTYSTYSRVSTASTALLDSEIDAILGTGAPPRRDTALSEYSEYSYYDGSSSPSTPGLLEADIDQLLAETTGGLSGTGEMQSRRMTAIMEHGLGFDISDLEIADYGEKTRQTRYLKGRNSELDSELGESGVLFCIPGKEMVGGGWTEKGYR